MTVRLLVGHVLERLAELPDGSVHAVMTSPPFYGLRDYGLPPQIWGQTCCEHPHEWGNAVRSPWANEVPGPNASGKNHARNQTKTSGQYCGHVHEWAAAARYSESSIRESRAGLGSQERTRWLTSGVCACGSWFGSLGLEPTPELYVEHLVSVFREVRRVLRPDGVCWLNLGDSYYGDSPPRKSSAETFSTSWDPTVTASRGGLRRTAARHGDLKPKDLMLLPEQVALALRADGWWVRSRVPWVKRNAMPESQTSRPSNSIEYVFLLAKSDRYFWDAAAVRVDGPEWPGQEGTFKREHSKRGVSLVEGHPPTHRPTRKDGQLPPGRNRRNGDWLIESFNGLLLDEDGSPLCFVVNPQPFKGAHFAVWPAKLVEPMVLASTSARGCCPECGAQWERAVARRRTGQVQKKPDGWDTGAGGHGTFHRNGREKGAPGQPVMETVDIGWRPACAHYDPLYWAEFPQASAPRKRDQRRLSGDWWRRVRRRPGKDEWSAVPAVVLDPFSGSGTTGLVADRLGRDAVLIDLKPEYVQMGQARITDDGPLFAEVVVA